MFTLAIGVALLSGARSMAWALEALLSVAVAAVVFGRSCAGANLYCAFRRLWTKRTEVRLSRSG
jgi:hypothetical protein